LERPRAHERKNDGEEHSASPTISVVKVGAVLALVAVALAAAGARAETAVVVSRGSAALPAGCAPADVARLLVSFADAESRGDLATLDGLFAPAGPTYRDGPLRGESGFVEYSVTEPGLQWIVSDRAQLLAYFAKRHETHEVVRLVQVAVFPDRAAWPYRVQIEYVFAAQADDLGVRVLSGKGEVNCRSATIPLLQINLLPPDAPLRQSQCPQPADWNPDGPPLACAMRPSAWEVSPDFRPARRAGSLPERCAYPAALSRLSTAFRALNAGSSRGFGGSFDRSGVLVPWPRGAAVRGRRAIVAFAAERVRTVTGWTLTRLGTPRRLRARARYRLAVRVSENGVLAGDSAVTLALDCRSGLIDSLARG
jgi:hypothetical protein